MRHFLQPDDDWNRVASVRPLTMATLDGTRYSRSAAVESEIAETLSWSESDVLGKRKALSNEALVYNVRRFRGSDEAVKFANLADKTVGMEHERSTGNRLGEPPVVGRARIDGLD